MARPLAWTLPDDCRLLPQHVRRRGARPAGSPVAGRAGQLRRCDEETQTRPPRPADQPVLLGGALSPIGSQNFYNRVNEVYLGIENADVRHFDRMGEIQSLGMEKISHVRSR